MAEEKKMATVGLKPGLKLPPKPGATVMLKPGLRLPPKPGLATAAKPGATVSLKPGLKLPPKPGATVALKPGLKLPPKPVIHKPGATVMSKPLPKPIVAGAKPTVTEAAKPVTAEEVKPTVTEAVKPVTAEEIKPEVAEIKPVTAEEIKPEIPEIKSEIPEVKPLIPEVKPVVPEAKPVPVDAQGVGRLPTVKEMPVVRSDEAPVVEGPKPIEALKSVTQKLKGITQEVPPQAILRKTGIIAEGAMSEAQKEAAKHKTARISLSDAMGVAPVKHEMMPMKTIRIKRPIDIAGATKPLAPQLRPENAPEAKPEPVSTTAETEVAEPKPQPTTKSETSTATITQRKTLKISRPGVVRPGGKFGIKRPSAAATAPAASAAAPAATAPEAAAGGDVPEIADIPEMPSAGLPPAPLAPVKVAASDGPSWLWVLSSLVQAAACVAIGALAWYLYQNTQIAYF